MRWPRANLEEKQEPRAATSASAERPAEGISHDVTRKGLTKAAIEKATFTAFLDGMDSGAALSYSPFSGRTLWSVASQPYLLSTWSVTAA
jgi:hypothetical protein